MDKYISIKVILDNILDHPLLKDVTLERAINHTVNFIKIVGCPKLFKDKVAIISIEDYRGLLPDDCNEIIQIRTATENNNNRTFRYSTDTFHLSEDKVNHNDLTYKIQGNVIYTSMKNGDIEIAYNAIQVDDCGFPIVPNNSSFTRALELYIKKYYFTILFDLGKIPGTVYNNTLQEYAWAVGQAQSDLIRPSIDQMKSITNMWNKLLPGNKEHQTGYLYQGAK